MTVRARAALSWSGVAVTCVAVLLAAGDPLADTVRYLAVWLLSTVVPGVLLWRALAGRRTWSQDVGFGAASGIGWLLLAWAVTTALGIPRLLWLWPAAVVAAFAMVPTLRVHWRPPAEPSRHIPAAWHLAMGSVCGVAVLRLSVTTLQRWALPPEPQSYFRDLWYHLGMVAELTRTWRPQDPAVAGERLRYHWFADAHMAATEVLTGLPGQQIVLHLWIVPMLVTLLLVAGAAAECLCGRWWAGPLAGLAVGVVPVTLNAIDGVGVSYPYASGFLLESHSSCLAVVVLLALVGPVSDVLRDRHRPGTWVLVVLLSALAAGSKPTVLPTVLAGTVLAALVLWRVERRVPRAALLLAAIAAALLALAAVTVTGSTGGSKVQLLGLLNITSGFVDLSGDTTPPASGGWLVNGLDGAGPSLWLLAMAFFIGFTCTELPRLLALGGPLWPTEQRDPVTWWIAGVLSGGLAATWLLSHPAFSQLYFLRTVESLGAVATVALLARMLPPGRLDAAHARALAVMLGAGIGVALVVRLLWPPPDYADVGSLIVDLLVPFAILFVGLAAAVVAARRVQDTASRRPPLLVLTAAFLLAAAVPGAVADSTSAAQATFGDRDDGPPRVQPTRSEQVAALWLNAHSDPDDIVVTNVFCSPPGFQPRCQHNSFWVAGLTGRRLVLGGWSYTARNLTESSAAGVAYKRYRSPWPERLRLSLAAVRRPSPPILARLQDNYAARWIFADRRATAVSPRLAELADLQYRNEDVVIYELPESRVR